VQRVDAVEHDAGCAGAGERGGDFAADIAGFANADDDDFAALSQCLDDDVDSALERRIEMLAHRFECGDLDIKDFPGAGQMTHGREACQFRGARATEIGGWPSDGVTRVDPDLSPDARPRQLFGCSTVNTRPAHISFRDFSGPAARWDSAPNPQRVGG